MEYKLLYDTPARAFQKRFLSGMEKWELWRMESL